MCVAEILVAAGVGAKTAGIIGGVTNAAFTIGGGLMDARAQNQQADYNAAVARNNALQAQYSAQYEEERSRDEARRRLSSQFASRSGITPDGAPLEVLGAAAAEAELDAQAIRYGGASRARAAQQQGDAIVARQRSAAGKAVLGGATGAFKALGSSIS